MGNLLAPGSQSGPQQGQANSTGSSFSPGDVTYKKEKIGAKKLSPRGMVIGKLDVKGPSKRGEATFELSPSVRQAVQELTEEVEKEPLPIEHRRHLRRFFGVLQGDPVESSDDE